MELDIVKNAISQTLASVSSDIPATTVYDALRRCCSSWHSIYGKYKRDLEHINSDLAPDLNNIMKSQVSMVKIADIASRQTYNTPSRLNSITCLEKQNKETKLPGQHSDQGCIGVGLGSTSYPRQSQSVRHDTGKADNGSGLDVLCNRTSPYVQASCSVISKRQSLSKRLDAWKQILATTQEADCHITDASNLSSTQASPGVVTPLEGWTDIGSDSTEKIGEEPTCITSEDLDWAIKWTKQFLRWLELFMDGSLGNICNSAGVREEDCAEMAEGIRRKYSNLRYDLDKLLHVTQRVPLLEHLSPTRGCPLASQSTDQTANPQSVGGCHEDKALEAIFRETGSEVTNEDIARFARYWTR